MKEDRIHLFEREGIVILPSNEHESRWNSSLELIAPKEHSMGRRVSCERIPLEYSNYWSPWHSLPPCVSDRIGSDEDLERSMSIVRWWTPRRAECRFLFTGDDNPLPRYSPIENCCFSSVAEWYTEEYSSCQCNQERISPSPIVCQWRSLRDYSVAKASQADNLIQSKLSASSRSLFSSLLAHWLCTKWWPTSSWSYTSSTEVGFRSPNDRSKTWVRCCSKDTIRFHSQSDHRWFQSVFARWCPTMYRRHWRKWDSPLDQELKKRFR